MSILSGWGRTPKAACHVVRARTEGDVAASLGDTTLIARGNGRSYGDSALNPALTLDMRGMDRMLSFDAESGTLVAEAGVLLEDIIDTFLPHGWFPAVTPGTKFVSLGGAIAADVHGKNHHRDGAFGSFVDWIEVMGADGQVTRASRDGNSDLFGFTLGGMGLTGVILRAQIRLRRVESGWIVQQTLPTGTLEEAIDAFEANLDALYSVAWIDSATQGRHLGRSLVMLGHHATPDQLPSDKRRTPFAVKRKRAKRVPLDFPGFALNRYSVRAFNELYYRMGARKTGRAIVDWDTYFYPLDAILDWNRIYGKRGFFQFQCALPTDTARAGMHQLVERIAASGQGSFLSVLKRFGAQESRFSFPQEGYTLALDFPANDRSLELMDALDRITLENGGRFYLAKDGRVPRTVFSQADPRAAEFAALRREQGWDRAFASLQSERLGL